MKPRLLGASFRALAASALTTSISTPAGNDVYADGRYTVTGSNVGNRSANSASVSIQLPQTHTSPQVHLRGDVGAMSSSCGASGTTVTCSLGSIRSARSASVCVDVALSVRSEPLIVTATASTTSSENSTSDKTGTHTVDLDHVAVTVPGEVAVVNDRCTGAGLTAGYECTRFPSSISGHDGVFHTDGTLAFPTEAPLYCGEWEIDPLDPPHLAMVYRFDVDVVGEFDGYGVDASGWEGLTTFPGSTSVAPHSVCMQ